MSKFSVIHDLGPLSDAQRQQYLRDASEHFGLNPDLNALDLIWMDNGGFRRLIAYARRGTTDILREIHQINVLSINMSTGPAFVCFTAIGKNPDGRQEIAVGAAGTEGLKGDRLAAAVATAQTRALRRLTLQFVGGGLLDESEIGDNTTTDINKLNVSLSSIATAPVQPVVEANANAGKDVTPAPIQVIDAVPTQVNSALMPNPVPFSAGSIVPVDEAGNPTLPVEEPKRKRRKKTVEDIVEEAGIQTEVQSPIIPLLGAVSPSADIPESRRTPTPHPGYRVTHVDEAVGVESTQAEVRPEIVQHAQDSRERNKELLQMLATDFPTDEQDKAFRARLSVFTNGVLKEGGMTDGIIWRVRKYTTHLCPDALIEGGKMKLTTAEWTKLLDSLENINKTGGPKTLVLTINEVAEKA